MMQRFVLGTLGFSLLAALGVACGTTDDPTGQNSLPSKCEPVACDLHCDFGFATSDDGCEICECNAPSCDAPSPAGCVETGCGDGFVCDTSVGCEPSSCFCDAESGGWICTDDCGGGTCVPEHETCCDEPNPAGCVETGCDDGFVCDTSVGCEPSSCFCDAETGSWSCTEDCGGGTCVPAGGGTCGDEPNPAGCIETGCGDGFVCDITVGCEPSSCFCDEQSGTWGCTDDCSGGTCVPAGGGCSEPSPAGCIETGCADGSVCDTTVGCFPSACFCDGESGGWACTDDCSGGACVKP